MGTRRIATFACALAYLLLPGAAMFAVGALFHLLIPIFAPSVQFHYNTSPIFRPWPGATQTYMLIHPWAYGVAFAAVFWLFAAPLIRDVRSGLAIGATWGGIVWAIGSLPVFLLVYAAVAIQREVVVGWIVQNACQYVAAGVTLGAWQARSLACAPVGKYDATQARQL